QIIRAQRHQHDERQLLIEGGVEHGEEPRSLHFVRGGEQLFRLVNRDQNLRLVGALTSAEVASKIRESPFRIIDRKGLAPLPPIPAVAQCKGYSLGQLVQGVKLGSKGW